MRIELLPLPSKPDGSEHEAQRNKTDSGTIRAKETQVLLFNKRSITLSFSENPSMKDASCLSITEEKDYNIPRLE